MKSISSFLLLIFLFTSGCDSRKKQEAFEKRQAELDQREQQLLLREKRIELKEQELLKEEYNTDSTQNIDSTRGYNALIPGNWTTKMACTETNCSGSAVGDTKVERWNISYQGSHLIAKAMAADKLVRVYTGSSSGNMLELAESSDSSSAGPAMKITIRLTIIDEKNMEGQREIVRNNNCKIVYALEMMKE